ncbi:MAG: class I SAM-dependent methyltransferase [Roseovarius sp.]
MDARLQLRVQRYGWDAAAPVYEAGWRDALLAPQEAMLEMARLAPGQRVIETAAGTGLASFPAARAVGPAGHVLATDISGEMVDLGAARAAELGLSQVRFARQNAEALDAGDGSFDRAICALGLMYCPDPGKALSEMARVLRPGGRAAVAVWGERRHCGWASIFPITDARVHSEVCPMFFGLGAPGALERSMRQAGFSEFEERRLSVTIRFPSDAALLEAVIDGGAVAMAAKRFDPAVRAEVDAEFLASVAAFRMPQGYAIPGEFVIATGTV